MAVVVPAIESANYSNLLGVRRPHREIRAFCTVYSSGVRAKPVIQPDVAAFVKKVEIVIAEQRHWRVPRRFLPFFGFARLLVGRGVASWAALCWLPGHFEDESPPRDPPD